MKAPPALRDRQVVPQVFMGKHPCTIMDFSQSFKKIRDRKGSQLCVGIDPAYPGMRDRNVIPSTGSPVDDILSFALDIVEQTGTAAAVFKPNMQYIMPLGLEEMQELNAAIHAAGSLSLLDVKVSDIGETNIACCHWAKEAGFDAITGSPFPGNIASLWEACSSAELGLFVLCLMSNPEAGTFMKSRIGDEVAYRVIARDIRSLGVTGAVVGATVASEDARAIAAELPSSLVLVPGIGAQQGTTDVLALFGGRCVVNVSRGVIFDENPGAKAEAYRDLIAKICP